MTAYFKKSKTLLFILFLLLGNANAQKIVTLDYCSYDQDNGTFSFLDTIPFMVHVIVDDTSATNDNTLFGDLFYWYQTDSMNSVNPSWKRQINTDLSVELVPDGGKFDTVLVDLRPDELRNGPVNVMCLWADMLSAGIVNSIPCCSNLNNFMPGLGLLEENNSINNTLYPNPTSQYLFIQAGQIPLIQDLSILTMDGKIVQTRMKQEFTSGFIDIGFLQSGVYIIQVRYLDNTFTRTKIQKQ